MNDEKNIGITGYIPFSFFHPRQSTEGSTYLRFDQLALHDNSFERWSHGKKYDNLIFQKAYWLEMMDLFMGPKVLDICDPDWIRQNLNILEICEKVHAVTCSSPELTKLMKTYLPNKIVEHVPDRLNIGSFPPPRKRHEGNAQKVVWFGYIHNARETLGQLVPFLLENNLHLTIISDFPYEDKKTGSVLEMEYRFIKYEQTTVYHYLKEADIVLNPRSNKAGFRFKSNNKSLIGWQMGQPVAATTDDLVKLMDATERNREVEEKQEMIVRDYDIRLSAAEYRSLFERIRQEFF